MRRGSAGWRPNTEKNGQGQKVCSEIFATWTELNLVVLFCFFFLTSFCPVGMTWAALLCMNLLLSPTSLHPLCHYFAQFLEDRLQLGCNKIKEDALHALPTQDPGVPPATGSSFGFAELVLWRFSKSNCFRLWSRDARPDRREWAGEGLAGRTRCWQREERWSCRSAPFWEG